MTIAEISKSDKIKVLIHGHSGYAENGSDIICAGISSLAQAFAMTADNIVTEESDGFMSMAAEMNRDNETRLNMMIAGLKAISDHYPQYFEIFLKI